VSHTTNNQKINSKIEFIVDDEDDVDEKQSRLSRKNSKSNIDGMNDMIVLFYKEKFLVF
jgi:hypothetical protein